MLHFSYGVMGSSKSAMLLMQHYNHVQLGHYVVLVKPAIDTRIDGDGNVIRTGSQILIDNQQEIKYIGLCYKHWKLGQSHG